MENYMKLEIKAIGENESFARSAVAAFALSLTPSLAELSDIKTAVSEAVTNCIVHAYKKGGKNAEQGKIFIECRADRKLTGVEGDAVESCGVLHIQITDYGCGIDNVDEALTPFFTTLSGEERSGLGFTIMQTFMSDFAVESSRGGGTKVLMSKVIGNTDSLLPRGKKEVDNA